MTPELEAEGFAREVIRRIQSMRKELDLNVDDKIKVEINILDDKKKAMIQQWEDYIQEETRAEEFHIIYSPKGKLVKKWDIDGILVTIGIV